MAVSETALELYNTLENLKNIISKKRFDLIELTLTPFVLSAQKYLSLTTLNEVFLEFLMRLSEAIYLKSCLLINTYVKSENEMETSKELKFEEYQVEKKLNYYKALPLDRILFDRIFLSKVPEILEKISREKNLERGEKSLILKAILSILAREEFKERMQKNFSAFSIEFYMNELKKYLKEKISFSFRELIEEKVGKEKENRFAEIVYYFLSLLFLCFEEICYMIQNSENEDIVVFSKNHL